MGWDVFISHASEDKHSVARPLAQLLRSSGVRVWLDENELHLGDSLREKIDEGLVHCRYGVVILSEAFFAKQWPQRELNGLFARETAGQNILLPVWHGVDRDRIARFSPLLADRLGVDTSKGLDFVANEIGRALNGQIGNAELDLDQIRGKWDSAQIERIVRAKLVEAANSEMRPFAIEGSPMEPIDHWVVGEYNLKYRNRESILVIAASIEHGSDCHACAPFLSLFEFERSRTGWKLIESTLAVNTWGQWGRVDENDVKVFVIGENLYALFLDITGTGQGYLASRTSVQTVVGDAYKEVLNIQTAESDSGTMAPGKDDWNSVIKMVPGTSGLYDLLVQRKGVRQGRSFEESERFKFDGRKYVSSALYG